MPIRKDIDLKTPIIIYALIDPRNPERIRYIGWTSRSELNKRLLEHIKESKLGGKTYKCNWIRSLLNENINPEINKVEDNIYKNKDEREQYWINYYGRENLTNGTNGGEGCLGLFVSDETKKCLSEKSKIQMSKPGAKEYLSNKAKEQWSSEESRKNLSDMAKERWKSDEFRKNQIEKHKGENLGSKNPMFGKLHSDEAKKKISDARKNMKSTQETKDKISMGGIGVKKKNSKSKYFGVSKNNNNWAAKIRYNRQTTHLGSFKLEIDAAKAYDKKCYELYGDKAKLNFPEDYNLPK